MKANQLLYRRVLSTLCIALVLGAASGWTQKLPPGPQVLTFFSDVDDSEQPYGLYLPRNFDANRKYPLVVMLHGAGSNHRLSLRRVFGKSNAEGENDVEATRYFPAWADIDYIVATPYARGTMGYQGIAEKDVWDVLADVRKRFPIDEDRTYLTGLSMGGGGTLWIGLSRPDVWAAIAPICPAPPFGTIPLAPNALNLPVHLFQGDADPLVSAEGTRQWVKRLQDAGAKVQYTEYPGVGHNSWEKAYADEAVFTWFGQFRRNRYPDRVRFGTDMYKHDGAYWVAFDDLTPGVLARIDASFTGPNKLEIATADLQGFSLQLAGHPKFAHTRPLQLSIDGTALTTTTAGAVSLVRSPDGWAVGKPVRPAISKQRGLEGPIGDAISRRHVLVYGTAGNPSPDEAQRRREIATRAGTWVGVGAFGGRVAVSPRIISDAQVRPSDVQTSTLVLFGTNETNTVIAKLAEDLPMRLNPEAKGYGLLYLYPVEGRYVLVSSGTPWFSLTDPVPAPADGRGAAGRGAPASVPVRPGFDFLPPVQRALIKFEDFLLFKGSPENVIAAGRFDRHWALTPADAEKIKASGVVTLSTPHSQLPTSKD